MTQYTDSQLADACEIEAQSYDDWIASEPNDSGYANWCRHRDIFHTAAARLRGLGEQPAVPTMQRHNFVCPGCGRHTSLVSVIDAATDQPAVPREPIEAMRIAGMAASRLTLDRLDHWIAHIWRAMHDAWTKAESDQNAAGIPDTTAYERVGHPKDAATDQPAAKP